MSAWCPSLAASWSISPSSRSRLLRPCRSPRQPSRRRRRGRTSRRFDSCQALVGYAHRNAAVTGGGVGVPMRAQGGVTTLAAPVMKTTEAGVDDSPSAVSAPAASGTGSSAPEFSTTNVQEAGIDEPDVVKTDGRHVYVAAGQQLRVIDVAGDAPRQVGTLDPRRWLRPSAADPRHTRAGPLDGLGADCGGRRAGPSGDRPDARPLDGPADRGRPHRAGRAEGCAHDDARRQLRRCADGRRNGAGRRQLDAR